jgi:spermidine synthase
VVILIPTTLMGATFPVIAKFYVKEKIGKGVGEVYSANNLGAILGSFTAGFLLIPLLGIKASIIFAASLNIVVGFLILYISAPRIAKKIIPLTLVVFIVLAFFGSYNITKLYSGGFYRAEFPKKMMETTEFLYYREGLHATISVTKDPMEGATVLLINGKGQGSTAMNDVRVNLLLAYLPLLLNPESKKTLVIGLGTGTTSGQLAQFTNTTTIEIEPAVVEAARYFSPINLNVLENPNHKLIIADGRNYLLQSKEKWDVIAQEPCDPWQSFSTALYSKEFFELVEDHLDADGLFVKWIPIYDMSPEDFKSVYHTFNSVFPYVIAFANVKEDEAFPVKLETSEIIFVGSKEKIFSEEKLRKNFNALSPIAKNHLELMWINSADDLLHLLLFTNENMKGYGEEASLITDNNPKLEFSTSKRVLYQNPKQVIQDIEKFLKNKSNNSDSNKCLIYGEC